MAYFGRSPKRSRVKKATCVVLVGLVLGVTGSAPVAATVIAPSPSCVGKVVAGGDMNNLTYAQATGAQAVAQHPDIVATLGDQQYPTGSLADYRAKYDHTGWGTLKPLTRPVPGHHEYDTPGAAGYYAYFDVPPYYAYDAGCGWRGYALNSLLTGSDFTAQLDWLNADLAANAEAPVLVTFSDPRYTSGTEHGPSLAMAPIWAALAGRTGVVANGHEHNYERFAPLNGIREFVAGTGGGATYPFGPPAAGSEARITGVPGILVLTLSSPGPGTPSPYTWAFLDRFGTVQDAGRNDVPEPATNNWFVRAGTSVEYGLSSDIPVPRDYNGDGRTDIAVYRPSNSAWFVLGQLSEYYGTYGDVPVAADYNGDGRADLAVWRPSNGWWYVNGIASVQWGESGDIPVPADYNGDGKADIAVFRPSTGVWYVLNQLVVAYGQMGDIPVADDYNNDGRADLAVFRPSNGTWYIRGVETAAYGQDGDIPVAKDYNGDHVPDLAVYRPANGYWYVRNMAPVPYGRSTDRPVPGYYNGDGHADLAVFR